MENNIFNRLKGNKYLEYIKAFSKQKNTKPGSLPPRDPQKRKFQGRTSTKENDYRKKFKNRGRHVDQRTKKKTWANLNK